MRGNKSLTKLCMLILFLVKHLLNNVESLNKTLKKKQALILAFLNFSWI